MSPETPWVSGSSAALVMIVTSTAVPIDAATWRIVLFIAVPCGISDRGSSFSAAVVTGMSTIAVPSMRAAFTAAMRSEERRVGKEWRAGGGAWEKKEEGEWRCVSYGVG